MKDMLQISLTGCLYLTSKELKEIIQETYDLKFKYLSSLYDISIVYTKKDVTEIRNKISLLNTQLDIISIALLLKSECPSYG